MGLFGWLFGSRRSGVAPPPLTPYTRYLRFLRSCYERFEAFSHQTVTHVTFDRGWDTLDESSQTLLLRVFELGVGGWQQMLHFPLPPGLAQYAEGGPDPQLFRRLFTRLEAPCTAHDVNKIVAAIALAELMGLEAEVAEQVRAFTDSKLLALRSGAP